MCHSVKQFLSTTRHSATWQDWHFQGVRFLFFCPPGGSVGNSCGLVWISGWHLLPQQWEQGCGLHLSWWMRPSCPPHTAGTPVLFGCPCGTCALLGLRRLCHNAEGRHWWWQYPQGTRRWCGTRARLCGGWSSTTAGLVLVVGNEWGEAGDVFHCPASIFLFYPLLDHLSRNCWTDCGAQRHLPCVHPFHKDQGPLPDPSHSAPLWFFVESISLPFGHPFLFSLYVPQAANFKLAKSWKKWGFV